MIHLRLLPEHQLKMMTIPPTPPTLLGVIGGASSPELRLWQ